MHTNRSSTSMYMRVLFFLPALLVACAGPRYAASPIRDTNVSNRGSITLVRDDAAGKPFHDAIEAWLKGHGYAYKVVPAGTKTASDELTLQYSATWGMDLAQMFISKAHISASTNGGELG